MVSKETPHQPPNPGNNPYQRKQDSACDDHADGVFLVLLNIQSKKTSYYPEDRDPVADAAVKADRLFFALQRLVFFR